MAGMATAMAMGMVASSSEESAGIDDRAPSPEELVGNAELLDRIRAILPTLPEKERLLIEKHYFGDKTLDEAAASLGLSKSWEAACTRVQSRRSLARWERAETAGANGDRNRQRPAREGRCISVETAASRAEAY